MEPSSTLGGWNSDSSKLFEETKSGGGWSFCFDFDSKRDEFFSEKCYMTQEEMVVMGPAVVSRSHSLCSTNLMQNCDLPPPVKVFTGADQTGVNPMRPKHIRLDQEEHVDQPVSKNVGESDKLELMKALQLSQSRARTAEKKASVLAEEKDQLSTLLLKESLRLFAHRQWVKLLQLEVSQLRSNKQKQQQCRDKKHESDKGSAKAEDGENAGGLTWCFTLALCLGIAGVSVAIGYRYIF